jgi:ABC-type phosphate transport system substrate-binding protein
MNVAVMFVLIAVAITADAPSSARRTRLVVIVPASQTLTDFSVADLRRIYRGEITRWPDGRRIIPVMLAPRSREADLFLKRVVLMSAIDFAQQWIGAVFRGRAPAPPVVLTTPADVMRFVSTHPDAITFLGDDVDVTPAVHIATIDHKSPDSIDYPLKW